MILTLLDRKEGGQTDVMVVLRYDEARAVLDGSRGPLFVRLERIREVVEANGERLENIDSICVLSADAMFTTDESVHVAMERILGSRNTTVIDHRQHAPARN